MPAPTIELACPGCVEELELDAGFAGGVARCSSCGTLMTVPAERHARPERLIRPERPGATPRAQRPPQPTAPSARPDRPAAPGTQPTAAPMASTDELPEVTQASADEAGVYTTESGRTVRIEQGSRIATARKRRTGVRITTGVIFGGLVLLIVGLCIWGAVALLQSMNNPGDDNFDALALQTFPYVASRNPLLMEEPNLLGLAIRDGTVVVVDTGKSGEWLDEFKQAARVGLTRGGSEAGFNLIYATPSGPVSYSDRLRRLSTLSESSLDAVGAKVKPADKDVDATAAIREAADLKPEAIIFVTGTKMEANEKKALEDATRGRRLDALVIASGFPPTDAVDLARERGGVAEAILTPGQLKEWAGAAPVR